MRVLHTECSMEWGGQEYRTVLESNYLNATGHTSWIACHPRSMLFQKGRDLGANLLPMDLTQPWRLDRAFKIHRFCRRNGIDVINSHGSKDSTLSLLSYVRGIPLVRSRQITNPIKKMFSYKYGCSHVIATATVIKESLIRRGVAESKITVVGEGVDLEEYSPRIASDYLRREFNLSPADRVVVNIGMVREDKGQRFYVEAARRLLRETKDIKFFLVGEGVAGRRLEKELKELVARHGMEDNFIMTGYREDVSSFIHLSDLVVIASTGTEAQSRIAPQTFATGRTVVATDVGGLTDLVKDNVTGKVVPPENGEAIASAIKLLLSNEKLKGKLEGNALEFARQELSFETMMNKTVDLYKTLADRAKKGRPS